jgi:hypothetical protein
MNIGGSATRLNGMRNTIWINPSQSKPFDLISRSIAKRVIHLDVATPRYKVNAPAIPQSGKYVRHLGPQSFFLGAGRSVFGTDTNFMGAQAE